MRPADENERLPWQREIVYALQIAALLAAAIYILTNISGFLSRIQTFVAIIVGAIFVAYAVKPAVNWLEKRCPRNVAIAITYFGLVAFLAATTAIVVPSFVEGVNQFINEVPHATAAYHAQIAAATWVHRLPSGVGNAILHVPERLAGLLGNPGVEATTGVVAFAVSAVSAVLVVVVIPILAVYLLLEAGTLRRAALWLTPPAARLPIARVGREIDLMIGNFIRGQFIVALIVAAMMTTLLLVLRIKYAILIGVLAGFLDVIPYAGAVAGWLPAFAIALFTNGWESALLVTLGIIAINQIEGNVLVPRIIGERVDLSPLTVIVALFIGGELLGILGLLIAVPAVAIFRIVGEKLVEETVSSGREDAKNVPR